MFKGVEVHVHTKAGTNVRANERKRMRWPDMKTGGHERKEETKVCEGEGMKGEPNGGDENR